MRPSAEGRHQPLHGAVEGPTEDQLAELKKYGMQAICDQNAVGTGPQGRSDHRRLAARRRA